MTAIAAVVLARWGLDQTVLERARPNAASMKTATAFSFILGGVAMWLLRQPGSQRRRWGAGLIAGVILAIALGAVFHHLQASEGWMERLMPRDAAASIRPADSGRMTFAAAVCLVLGGSALGLLALRRMTVVVPILGAVVTAFGGFVLVGHAGNLIVESAWWGHSAIAVHTAAAFALLGIGLVALAMQEPGSGWALDGAATSYFMVAIALLLGVWVVTYGTLKSFSGTAATVSQTNRVHARILDLRGAIGEAIAAQRAFILTVQDRYLEAARTAAGEAVNHQLALTQLLTAGGGEIGPELERADAIVRDIVAGIVEGSTRDAQVRAARATQIPYENLRVLLDRMDAEEAKNLRRREEESRRDFNAAMRFIPAGTLISVLLISAMLLTLNRAMGERRKAADSLAVERTLLRTLIDVLPEYIYVKDTDSRFVLCNTACARRFGVATTAELVGRADTDFFSVERAAEFREEETKVLEGTPVTGREETFSRADGVTETILTTKVPLRDAEGRVAGIVGMGHDITEKKRAEEAIRRLNADLERRVVERTAQLEAAVKELEAFSYSVSHDLRAPLRAMDGYSQAVIDDFGSQLPAEGHRYLDIIRQETQRMGQLIDDLLEFARLSRQPLQRRRVNTDTLVREVLADLHAQQEGRQLEIAFGALPSCLGDRPLLKQAWINLLSNALKYTSRRERAVIEIGCTRGSDLNTYFVRDNGTGFDMRYAEKLFGVFQRLHRADEFDGTGVGLAIVKRIIERHGGTIWAEAAVDRGATFYFTLPGTLEESSA